MKFCEKLDLIMNLTKTSNSALALHTELDASHISRLRRGERNLPKNEKYITAMSDYFSRHCTEDYQKESLSDILNFNGEHPQDGEQFVQYLRKWFLDDAINDADHSVENFLDALTHFQVRKTPPLKSGSVHGKPKMDQDKTSIFYGLQGKREAAISFLSRIAGEKEPQTVLLFSEEDMTWLTEDVTFSMQWASWMTQVISRGNKIKIIHTVNRNLDEMLAAIKAWMPLYLMGSIEPYYYPKKRDGVFRRTLFIAPQTAAVISTSVGSMSAEAANFLVKDKKAILTLAEEFSHYLMLCRPLIHIFTPRERQVYLKMLTEFEREKGDAILKTSALSVLTMPMVVVKHTVDRVDHEQKIELLEYFKQRTDDFAQNLSTSRFTEMIRFPELAAIQAGKVRVNLSEMINSVDLFYTTEDFRLHLENIVRLLETYDNYQVVLLKDSKEEDYMLYVKEGLGAMVAKTSAPAAVIAVNESNLTEAFWDYLSHKIDKSSGDDFNKIKTLEKLRAMIKALNNAVPLTRTARKSNQVSGYNHRQNL